MGSRSRFKPQVPNARPCVRCHKLIHNTFRKEPWCVECGETLGGMTFTGEEVLHIVLDIMPPTPPHPDATIKAWTVLRIARQVLLTCDLLLPNDDEPADQNPNRKILVG